MREMKDSGVKWIGKIPVTWKVSKLKYVFADGDEGLKIGPFGSAMKGKTLEEGPYKIYNQAHLIQNDFSLNRHFVSEDTFNELINYEVHPGDILFSMMGTIGKCQIMPEGFTKGIMDSHLLKSGIKDNINPYFLVYAYDKDYSDQAYTQLLYASNGTIMNGLNSSILKSVVIALPPKNEQDRIVDYLDSKCSKIDEIIAKQEKIIEKLKEYKLSIITEAVTKGLDSNVYMRNTGNKYIGAIPATWEVRKLKTLSSIISKGTTPSTVGREILNEGLIRFIKAENIQNNKLLENPAFFIDSETNEIIKRSQLQENDILFVIAGATIGKTAIIGKEFTPANTNQAVSFIRLLDENESKYVWYSLQADHMQHMLKIFATQAAQPNLAMEDLGNYIVLLPSREERNIIVSFLDTKCSTIDCMVKNKENIIGKLQEYKKSLIYEVVTGKKEV